MVMTHESMLPVPHSPDSFMADKALYLHSGKESQALRSRSDSGELKEGISTQFFTRYENQKVFH